MIKASFNNCQTENKSVLFFACMKDTSLDFSMQKSEIMFHWSNLLQSESFKLPAVATQPGKGLVHAASWGKCCTAANIWPHQGSDKMSLELAVGIFGDFGYCKLISHKLQSQRTNYDLPGIMWALLMTSEIVGSFNPAQINCPCNPTPSCVLYIGKDKCLLTIILLPLIAT